MIGWHYQLSGHAFEQTLGNGEGQGSLACCSPWGHGVEHDLATEQKLYGSRKYVQYPVIIHNQKIELHTHTHTHTHTTESLCSTADMNTF